MYNRIRELSQAATRGWPGKKIHKRGEAYNLLLAFKKKYPRRCHARKKKVKTDMIFAMIFMMLFAILFAIMFNHVYVCIMIFTVIRYVIRYDIRSVCKSSKHFV